MKNVSDPLKLFSNPFGNFKKHENHSRDFVEHVEGIQFHPFNFSKLKNKSMDEKFKNK